MMIGCRPKWQEFRHITQSQHSSKLTTLNINLFDVSADDDSADQILSHFFHSPKASMLLCLRPTAANSNLSLSLHNCNLVDSTVFAISQSPYLSNLCDLDLTCNPALTDDSVKYLAQSKGTRLKKLNLTHNPLLFHHLAQSPQLLSGLEEFLGHGCSLDGNDYRKIFAKAGWFDGEVFIDADF